MKPLSTIDKKIELAKKSLEELNARYGSYVLRKAYEELNNFQVQRW